MPKNIVFTMYIYNEEYKQENMYLCTYLKKLCCTLWDHITDFFSNATFKGST